MEYQYWIIRFVPNVARGEFTNIGIVCGKDDGDWAVGFDTRFVKNHGGLSSDLNELSSWERWFRRTVDSHTNTPLTSSHQGVSSGWIQHLRSRQANSVQFSEPAPIQVGSAREGVDLLFPHLVERTGARRARSLNRRSLRADLRDVLVHELDFQLGRNLFVLPRATIGKQRGAFDVARREDAAQRLTNVWAFNVRTLEPLEREIQSWNFLVSRLRHDGAELQLNDSRTIAVASDVPVEVVYDPPNTLSNAADRQWRTDIFEAALEAWSLNHVSVSTLDEFHARVREHELSASS